MAEISADISSYPKPAALPAQQSMLGQMGQYQQLQQGNINVQRSNIALSSDKLDLVNKEYTNVISRLSSAGKNIDANGLSAIVDETVKDGLVPPELAANVKGRIPSDPSAVPAYRDQLMQQLVDGQAKINNYHGAMGISPSQLAQPTNIQNAQTGRTDQGTLGQFLQQAKSPLLNENRLPVQQQARPQQPMQNAPRLPVQQQGQGTPIQGQSPLLESGIKQYSEDQDTATKLNTTNKPAELALTMIRMLRSGPGTDTWQKALAFGKANGAIATDAKNDSTVVYQTIDKLLNNFVRNTGARTDADMAQLQASNPDITHHINPALEDLTREQVGLNRAQAMRSGAFRNQDMSQYGEHRSKFPQSVDEKAVTLGTLPPAEASKLYNEMKTKAMKGDAGAVRFMKSLSEANRQGY